MAKIDDYTYWIAGSEHYQDIDDIRELNCISSDDCHEVWQSVINQRQLINQAHSS